MQQSLIDKEEFCMSVDAHVDVAQDWDVQLTAMWAQAGNEYAVLSSALPDVAALQELQHNNGQGDWGTVAHLCQATVNHE